MSWLNTLRAEFQLWRTSHRTRADRLWEIVEGEEAASVPQHQTRPEGRKLEVSPEQAAIMLWVYDYLGPCEQEQWAKFPLEVVFANCLNFAHHLPYDEASEPENLEES